MRLLFLTNIPSPYRLDFFNELGKKNKLKVIFEAEINKDLNKKWYSGKNENFDAFFLKKGSIEEKKINLNVLKHLKKNKQDYIIVTNYSYFTELLAILIIKLKRIPYLMEIDGGLIKKENSLLKKIKTFLIKNANGYFSPSKEADNFLIYYGAEANKIYRYPFTSLKQEDILETNINILEKDKIKKKLGIKETKMILSVGQFIPRKGFDLLIQSCKKIPDDTAVCIIGGTPTEDYLSLIEDHNLKNFYFPGFKTKKELKEYYKAADLFVLPTREDIWGLVINEAMAFGLPVITTDKCIAGLELVENYQNGFIIPSNDSDSLALKINIILADSRLRKRMSDCSLEKIERYTIENMVESHQKIFRKIKTEKDIDRFSE